MNKFILILLFLSILSVSKKKTIYLSGKYHIESAEIMYTQNLIKQKGTTTLTRSGSNFIEFKGTRFSEVRQPSCGNDISYKKTGTYYLSKSQFILNYTGGDFIDNVGGDSMQMYVKSKVYYNIKRFSKDTIQILWKSGATTKNVVRVESQR